MTRQLYKNRVLSFGMIRCVKCGGQFDPRVQSAWCGKKLHHFPVKQISEWLPPPGEPADKLKRQAPFQSDFMLLWDETQPRPRAPK